MAITYKEMFKDSLEFHPNAGVKLSKSACGFILPEIDWLVEDYQKELKRVTPGAYYRMVESHLSGLLAIRELIKTGYDK
jgi:hypothetical protein